MASKQSFDVDDDFLRELTDSVKNVMSVVTKWKDRDASLKGLAGQQVESMGIDPKHPEYDAQMFSRRTALKKMIQEQQKAQEPAPAPMGGVMPPPMSPAGPMTGPPPGLGAPPMG